jgi:hypothetical protein
MTKNLYALILLAALTSCASTYDITGSSSIPTLDGRMLYLTVVKNNELKNIDSCDVVHGEFHFTGASDSAEMANLYMDDQSLMPIVLEEGNIVIKLDNTQQNVTGTPLNDKLYKFLDKRSQLDNQMSELPHRESQMIMNGGNLDEIRVRLNEEANKITQQEDYLITTFITDNFDNVLGPGVFMMLTSSYKYPILTPQIEDIMSKATEKFKNNPFVKDYYQTAVENMQKINGVPAASAGGMAPPPPSGGAQPIGQKP